MTSMLSRLAYAVAAAVAWLAVAFPAMAEPKPGFDCAKASGPVEKLICSDAELAQLDRGLADQYGQLRPSLSPKGPPFFARASWPG